MFLFLKQFYYHADYDWIYATSEVDADAKGNISFSSSLTFHYVPAIIYRFAVGNLTGPVIKVNSIQMKRSNNNDASDCAIKVGYEYTLSDKGTLSLEKYTFTLQYTDTTNSATYKYVTATLTAAQLITAWTSCFKEGNSYTFKLIVKNSSLVVVPAQVSTTNPFGSGWGTETDMN